MKRLLSSIPLAFLIFVLVGWPHRTHAQATTGYTLVATVAFGTNTYTDTTPQAGQITNYEVLSINSIGQSAPSNIVSATTPATNVAHSNVLTWIPPTTGGTPVSYQVYKDITGIGVITPNPPTGLAVVAK